MAILMRSELQGITTEQLQPLIQQTKDRIKAYPGFIAQISGPIPGGYQVTEVWETQEASERGVREVVAPMFGQQLGLAAHPSVQYLPLDAVVTR